MFAFLSARTLRLTNAGMGEGGREGEGERGRERERERERDLEILLCDAVAINDRTLIEFSATRDLLLYCQDMG